VNQQKNQSGNPSHEIAQESRNILFHASSRRITADSRTTRCGWRYRSRTLIRTALRTKRRSAYIRPTRFTKSHRGPPPHSSNGREGSNRPAPAQSVSRSTPPAALREICLGNLYNPATSRIAFVLRARTVDLIAK